MPADRADGAGHDDAPEPKLGLWQRLAAGPAVGQARRREKPSLGERLSGAVLKPANPDSPTATPPRSPRRSRTLEHAVRYADDTERLIGLVAAPLSAVIALVVVSNQITHDAKHTSTYHGLELMFLVMALLVMAAAWYRKRLFMGIVARPLRAGHLQPPLLGVRHPLRPGRRLVPGAGLPGRSAT